jgi:two-component system LytT family response regulator
VIRAATIDEEARKGKRYATRLAVKGGGRIQFLHIAEIDWISSDGNYIRLHAGKSAHVMRGTIAGFEAGLDPAQFIRINRSTIVNIDRIASLQPFFQRDYVVTLRDGTNLRLLARYRPRLQAVVGGF